MNVSELKKNILALQKAMDDKGIQGYVTANVSSRSNDFFIGLWNYSGWKNDGSCHCENFLYSSFEECVEKAEEFLEIAKNPMQTAFSRQLTQAIEKGKAAGVDAVHLDLLRDTLDEYK